MSSLIGSYGADGALSNLMYGIDNSQQEESELAWQTGSGTVAPLVADLEPVKRADFLSVSNKITTLQADNKNYQTVSGRLRVSQQAMSAMSKIVIHMRASILGLMDNSLTPIKIENLRLQAKASLSDMAELLNTNDGEAYVFSGENYIHPPVGNPAGLGAGPLMKYFKKHIKDIVDSSKNSQEFLEKITSVVAAERTIGRGKGLFNSFMYSQQNKTLQMVDGRGVSFDYGFRTNEKDFEASDTSSGSVIIDTLRNLFVIGSISPNDISSGQYMRLCGVFNQSFEDLQAKFGDEQSKLGYQQRYVDNRLDNNKNLLGILQTEQAGDVGVNMADVAVKQQEVNLRLRASFEMVAGLKSLSLVDYI